MGLAGKQGDEEEEEAEEGAEQAEAGPSKPEKGKGKPKAAVTKRQKKKAKDDSGACDCSRLLLPFQSWAVHCGHQSQKIANDLDRSCNSSWVLQHALLKSMLMLTMHLVLQ